MKKAQKHNRILLAIGALLLVVLCLWWIIGGRGNTTVIDSSAQGEVDIEKELPAESGLSVETSDREAGDRIDADEAPYIVPDDTDSATDAPGPASQSKTDGENEQQGPEDSAKPPADDSESIYGDFF